VAGATTAMMTATRAFATTCAFALTVTGCASAPLMQKQSFDFKSTALFQKACPLPEDRQDPPAQQASTAQPAAFAQTKPIVAKTRAVSLETTENRCNTTYLEKMVENFLTIREADEKRGIPGDTIEEVRRKGFSVVVGGDPRVFRANTRALHGSDALAAVGMGVSAPQLRDPEEIKAYTESMSQHYGEEYFEKDMKHVVDRFCLNRRESLEIGDDRVFTIVWRQGHVIKRVIKGGPIANAKQDRGFLLCPNEFIVDTLSGAASSAAKTLSPIK
jgi:hypothetical protein